MSFQQQLEKLLNTILPRPGEVDGMTDELHEAVIETALTSIINLVDKELPKFIDVGKYDLDCPPTDLHRAAGYNQAISDVRKVLGLKDV